jgi:hypothetical protein
VRKTVPTLAHAGALLVLGSLRGIIAVGFF